MKIEKDYKELLGLLNKNSVKYAKMIKEMEKDLNATSLKYQRLEDMLKATGLPEENLCTYCWTGKED